MEDARAGEATTSDDAPYRSRRPMACSPCACFLPVRHLAASVVLAALAACGRSGPADPRFTLVAGADAARGQRLVAHYQCGRCHVVPDVPAAAGRIGPSLERFGRRSYIAGQAPNDAETLPRWIEDPQAVVPGTTMPDLGVNAADARDIAAYLLGLR